MHTCMFNVFLNPNLAYLPELKEHNNMSKLRHKKSREKSASKTREKYGATKKKANKGFFYLLETRSSIPGFLPHQHY